MFVSRTIVFLTTILMVFTSVLSSFYPVAFGSTSIQTEFDQNRTIAPLEHHESGLTEFIHSNIASIDDLTFAEHCLVSASLASSNETKSLILTVFCVDNDQSWSRTHTVSFSDGFLPHNISISAFTHARALVPALGALVLLGSRQLARTLSCDFHSDYNWVCGSITEVSPTLGVLGATVGGTTLTLSWGQTLAVGAPDGVTTHEFDVQCDSLVPIESMKASGDHSGATFVCYSGATADVRLLTLGTSNDGSEDFTLHTKVVLGGVNQVTHLSAHRGRLLVSTREGYQVLSPTDAVPATKVRDVKVPTKGVQAILHREALILLSHDTPDHLSVLPALAPATTLPLPPAAPALCTLVGGEAGFWTVHADGSATYWQEQEQEQTQVLIEPAGVSHLARSPPVNCDGGWYRDGNNKCQICPAGYYCGGSMMYPCAKGFYQPAQGQPNCAQCPGYTTSGTVINDHAEGAISCTPVSGAYWANHPYTAALCPAGSYCAGGWAGPLACTGQYQPHQGQSGCYNCPANSIPANGYTTCNMPGYYVNGGSLASNNASTAPCPAGHMCNGDGNAYACNGNSYQPHAQQIACYNCPANASGIPGTANTSCWMAGHYITSGSLTANNANTAPCTVGYYCPGDGTRSRCSIGYYTINTVGTHVTSQATGVAICPSGSYCPSGGYLYQCPSNKYQPHTGRDTCFTCPTNSTPNSDRTTCTMPSYYISSGSLANGDITIQPCPAGSACPGDGSRTTCPAKHWAAPLQTACTPCAAGSYTDLATGATSCTTCSPGHACDGSQLVIQCPGNTYQPSAGQSICHSCPANTTSGPQIDEIQIAQTTCTPNSGHYWVRPTGAPATSEPCQPGYACAGGDATPKICSGNYYQSQAAQKECKNVTVGYYSTPELGEVKTGQLICPTGSRCNSGIRTLCQGSDYQSLPGKTVCYECPSYSTVTSGNDTCLIQPGYYIKTGTLQDGNATTDICQRGFYCTGGDGLMTQCEKGYFQANYGETKCHKCTQDLSSNSDFTACVIAPGLYLTSGSFESGVFTVAPCMTGHYCPGGGSIHSCTDNDYQPNQGADICYKCPEHSTTTPDFTSCTMPGYYVADGTLQDNSAVLQPCPAGSYCDGDGTSKPCNDDGGSWPYVSSIGSTKCHLCRDKQPVDKVCTTCEPDHVSDYLFGLTDRTAKECISYPTVGYPRCFHSIELIDAAPRGLREFHTACGLLGADSKVTFGALFTKYNESAGEYALTLDDITKEKLSYACAMRAIGPLLTIPRLISVNVRQDSDLSHYLRIQLGTSMFVSPSVPASDPIYTLDPANPTEYSDNVHKGTPWAATNDVEISTRGSRALINVARAEVDNLWDESHQSVTITQRATLATSIAGQASSMILHRNIPTVESMPFNSITAKSFTVTLTPMPVSSHLKPSDNACSTGLTGSTNNTFTQTYTLPAGLLLAAMDAQPLPDKSWTLHLGALRDQTCQPITVRPCELDDTFCQSDPPTATLDPIGTGEYCTYTGTFMFTVLSRQQISVVVEQPGLTTSIPIITAVKAAIKVVTANVGSTQAGELAVCASATSARPNCTMTCKDIKQETLTGPSQLTCPKDLFWISGLRMESKATHTQNCTYHCTYSDTENTGTFTVAPITMKLTMTTVDRPVMRAGSVVVGGLWPERFLPDATIAVRATGDLKLISGAIVGDQCQPRSISLPSVDITATTCAIIEAKDLSIFGKKLTLDLQYTHAYQTFDLPKPAQVYVTHVAGVIMGSSVGGVVALGVVVVLLIMMTRKIKRLAETNKLLDKLNINEALRDYVFKLKDIMVDPLQVEVTGPVLGRGGFGTVIRGTFDGAPVAIKKLHGHLINDIMAVESIVSEAVVQTDLRHPHLVGFYGCVALGGTLGLVHEFCGDGSLKGACYGRSYDEVPLARRLEWLRQVASALAYLHSHNIAHRDLKAVNVLLADGGASAKLGDLGLARDAQDNAQATGMTMALGTPAWLAPEVIMNDNYDEFAADVYAFGIMAWEVLAGKEPFGDVAVFAIAIKITQDGERPPMDRAWPAELQSLLANCWEPSEIRPQISEIVLQLSAMQAY